MENDNEHTTATHARFEVRAADAESAERLAAEAWDAGAAGIEERGGEEVWSATQAAGVPEGIAVANPAFDVTPAQWVDCLVTERGLIAPSEGERPGRLEGAGMIKLSR